MEPETIWTDFCRSPSESAFRPLFDLTHRIVYTICLRVLRNPEDALDAFQSTYARLMALARQKGGADPGKELPASGEGETGGNALDPVTTLVARLAAREAWSLAGRRKRRHAREVTMDTLPAVSSSGSSPADEAAQTELRHRLETLLELLPDRYRVPLLLHYFNGLTYRQIAQALDLPVGTITSRIRRGVKKLHPLATRAGLREATTLLGAAVAAAHLATPPASVAAQSVFVESCRLASLAGGSASVAPAVQSAAAILKTKATVLAGLTVAGVLVLGTIAILRPRDPVTKPSAAPSAAPIAPDGDVATRNTVSPESPSTAPDSSDEQVATAKAAVLAAITKGESAHRLPYSLRVVWDDDQKPVANADVLIWKENVDPDEESYSGVTDADGRATLEIPSPNPKQRIAVRVSRPESATTRFEMSNMSWAPETDAYFSLRRSGSIFGTVVYEGEGKPAAGVRVLACDKEVSDLGGMGLRPFGYTYKAEAQTAPDGTFELQRVGIGQVLVFSIQPPYRSYLDPNDLEPIVLSPGQRLGPVQLVLREGLTLTGQVRDLLSQAPLPSAKVSCAEFGHAFETITDAAGRYRFDGLPAGRIYVSASLAGYHDGGEAATFDDNEKENRLDLALDPARGRVLAEVVDREGNPVEGAFLSGRPGTFKAAYTGADGRAELTGCSLLDPPEISASKEGYETSSRQQVAFPPGKYVVELKFVLGPEMPEYIQEGVFVGQVTSSDGLLLEGVQIIWAHSLVGLPKEAGTETDSDGRYRLVAKREHEDIPYKLHAVGDGWGAATRENPVPGTEENPAVVDFILRRAHWIAGVVVDPEGKPVEGASVRIDSPDPQRQLAYHGVVRASVPPSLQEETGAAVVTQDVTPTDSEGKFRFENIPETEVALLGGTREGEGFHFITAVDREVRIVLESAGAVCGRVLDRETGEPIPAFTVAVAHHNTRPGNRGGWPEKFASEEGRFEFRSLPRSGTFSLQAMAEGYEPEYREGIAAQVPDEAAEEVFALSPRRGEVVGRVVDAAAGTPLPGVTVFLAHVRYLYPFLDWKSLPGESMLDYRKILTDAEGWFRFDEGEDKGVLLLKAGTYAPSVVLPERRNALVDGETGFLRVPLSSGGSVEGIVLENRVPKSFAHVYLERQPDELVPLRQRFVNQRTNSTGQYQWRDLPSGTYHLVRVSPFHLNAFGDSRIDMFPLMRREFHLGEGETRTVNLGDGLGPLALEGTVVDGDAPQGGVFVRLVPQFAWDHDEFGAVADGDGRFHVEGLNPGAYAITLLRKVYRPSLEYETQTIQETVEIQEPTSRTFDFATAR